MITTGASLLFVVIYTFYNQLLINLRFFTKMKCVTCGLCIYDAFNYLCCMCLCKKSSPNRSSIYSVGKWIAIMILAVVNLIYVMEKNTEWEELFQIGGIPPVRSNFHIYMMIYAF